MGFLTLGDSAAAFVSLPQVPHERRIYQPREASAPASHFATGIGNCILPVRLQVSASAVTLAFVARGLCRRNSRGQSTCWSAVRAGAGKGQRARTSTLRSLALEESKCQASNVADVDSDIAALEREAAQLRAAAAELEAARLADELAERQRLFSEFDTDRSGGVDAAEIQRGMKEQFGMKLDDSSSSHILTQFDKNGSCELELEEFDFKHFQSALERKWAEDLAKEEEAARARAAEERVVEEDQDTLPGPNQDDGILVRLGCALAYLLPVLDGVTYGLPLAVFFPPLLTVLGPLVMLLHLVQNIPFGLFIWFVCLQYLSRQEWVPALLRYNLCQAVDLDIRICVFTLLVQLGPIILSAFVPFTEERITDGMITDVPTVAGIVGVSLGLLLATLVFLPYIASIMYSIACSLLGRAPRSIPMVSEEAERVMGMTPSKERGDE